MLELRWEVRSGGLAEQSGGKTLREKNEVPGGGQGRWREGWSSKSVNSLPLFSVYSRREGKQPRVWEEKKRGV